MVWQGDDTETRDAANAVTRELHLRVLHSPEVGVVPAENVALAAASGEVVLLIDDDAVAPADWVERHLRHYEDPNVGAVGGPANNFRPRPDGSAFPKRDVEPVGRLTWYGKLLGNMYDQPDQWREREAIEVQHLVGYNMSVRRTALSHFESALRPYWQLFELDACLQVSAAGYRIVFDYGNVVEHHPTNPVYTAGRGGDLELKVLNAAYNHGFVLAKWSPWFLWKPRIVYLLAVGSVGQPGLLGSLVAMRRFGNPGRELKLLTQTWSAHLVGWAAGMRARRSALSGQRSAVSE